MSVMFSGDALQCCNLGLRVNREWAKCYCFSRGESIGVDTFRQSQVVGRRLSIYQHVDLVVQLCKLVISYEASWKLTPGYLRRSRTMISWSRHARMTRPSSMDLSLI